jgi:hypothetical protein
VDFVHLDAFAHPETQRDREARLQQVFAETEAFETAQTLMQTHANEQALETRRQLEGAIQPTVKLKLVSTQLRTPTTT